MKLFDTITKGLRTWIVENVAEANAHTTDAELRDFAEKAFNDGKLTPKQLLKWSEAEGDGRMEEFADRLAMKMASLNTTTPEQAFSGVAGHVGNGNGRIRVKAAGEMYDATKLTVKHFKTGQPVHDEHGLPVLSTSQLEFAKAGAFYKYRAARDGIDVLLSEHEKALVEEMFVKDKWCGMYGKDYVTGFDGLRVKALISDATSGGAEINPEWFDDALVTFPLLHGELFPFIDLKPVPRGKSVEAASVGNPTMSWGIGEPSEIPLFDTDSLIAGIDTTIHPITAAVEVGRDLLADSAADVGQTLMENVGQRLLAELDRVIAKGNGSSEPTGITVASGLTDVPSTNGASGPPTVADYEGLMFAVGKQYRTAANRCAFIANDTVYSRARGIAVDASNDQRRVFGMDHSSYTLLEHPYRIQNDIANTKIVFGALARYKLYRRAGNEVRWESGGKELARRNTTLLIVRGRYGGRVMHANAFSIMDDAQT